MKKIVYIFSFKWLSFLFLGILILLVSSILITKFILQDNLNKETHHIIFQSDRPLIVTIIQKIKRSIHYPKNAYKNNIEGDVNVHFKLYQNGIINIVYFEGNKVFLPAIQKSIKKISYIEKNDRNMTFPQFFTIKVLFTIKGIIFFKDYWQRPGEKGKTRTGDHIDLWDNGNLAGQNGFENFITGNLGLYYDGVYSDKELSSEVLFWECEDTDTNNEKKSDDNESKSFFSFFGD